MRLELAGVPGATVADGNILPGGSGGAGSVVGGGRRRITWLGNLLACMAFVLLLWRAQRAALELVMGHIEGPMAS